MSFRVTYGCVVALVAATVVGCSDEARTEVSEQDQGANDLTPAEEVEGALVDLPEEEVEFRRRTRATLSATEQSEVSAILAAQGIASDTFSFAGRMVLIDDVYVDADELLSEVNKGKTLDEVFAESPQTYSKLLDAAGNPCSPQGPNCFFHFRRPLSTTFIVPNESVASGKPIRTMVQNALNAIGNAASDCITPPTVIDNSQWTALGQQQAYTARTFIYYGPVETACPGGNYGTIGCATFPQTQNINPYTYRFGGRIGLVNAWVTGNNRDSQWAVTHEILHTLGLAHMDAELSPNNPGQTLRKLRIPGTDASESTRSVMYKFCYPCDDPSIDTREACPAEQRNLSCNISFTLADDDRRAIDSLYSPQSGSDCSFSWNFQRIAQAQCWQTCTKMSTSNLAGECCTCNGVTKAFARSTWSATTFICQ